MAVSVGYGELDALQEQLEGLLKVREQLNRQIDAVERKVEALKLAVCQPGRITNQGPPLKGLKVAVVGPSFREAVYRKELGELGAIVLFAPSENKLGRISQVCGKAHGIIYITSFTGHDAQDHVMAAAKRRGTPVVRLRFTGIDRFRQAALELAPEMSTFRELLDLQ